MKRLARMLALTMVLSAKPLAGQAPTRVLAPGDSLPVAADCTSQDGKELRVLALFAEVLRAEAVDERPRLVRAGLQRAPDGWRGEHGNVRVEFVLDSTGAVVPCTMTVIEASHRAFVDPSLAMIRSSTFVPARSGGRPVAVRVSQGVAFTGR